MANRKAFEQEVLKWVRKIDPSGESAKFYEEMFEKMSDQDIENYVQALERGEDFISLMYTNLKDSKITIDNNLKVAKQMGHEFFQHLWLTDSATGRMYKTPVRYMVIDMPVRRQVQMLYSKLKVPKDNLHVDDLTGQPTGESKGAAISYPEVLLLHSEGLDTSLLEMIKFRGGDERAYNAMERSIEEQGGVNIQTLLQGNTRVKSTETLQAMLKAMHFDNNL